MISTSVKERFEGDRLFLTNNIIGTLVCLRGVGIDYYYKLKNNSLSVALLQEENPEFFNELTLAGILIVENSLVQKKQSFDFSRRAQFESHFAPIGVLWDITNRCNLRCIYCHASRYHHEVSVDLPFSELIKIANKLIDANVWEVVLSGGEALLRGDETFELIKHLKSCGVFVALLTNGYIVNDDIVTRLKALDVAIGVSLDTHNAKKQAQLRGEGTFEKAINAIKLLIQNGIDTTVICTVTTLNFSGLDHFLFFLEEHGVTAVTLQNLIPSEDIDLYHSLKLTPEQELSLECIIPALIDNHPALLINASELPVFARLLIDSKQRSNTLMAGCSACRNGGYIDAHGVFYPCTSLRMLPLGNLLDSDVHSLWMTSTNAKFVRNILSKDATTIKECQSCQYVSKCNTGCRGQAFTLTGNFFAPHDRCIQQLRKQM